MFHYGWDSGSRERAQNDSINVPLGTLFCRSWYSMDFLIGLSRRFLIDLGPANACHFTQCLTVPALRILVNA